MVIIGEKFFKLLCTLIGREFDQTAQISSDMQGLFTFTFRCGDAFKMTLLSPHLFIMKLNGKRPCSREWSKILMLAVNKMKDKKMGLLLFQHVNGSTQHLPFQSSDKKYSHAVLCHMEHLYGIITCHISLVLCARISVFTQAYNPDNTCVRIYFGATTCTTER